MKYNIIKPWLITMLAKEKQETLDLLSETIDKKWAAKQNHDTRNFNFYNNIISNYTYYINILTTLINNIDNSNNLFDIL